MSHYGADHFEIVTCTNFDVFECGKNRIEFLDCFREEEPGLHFDVSLTVEEVYAKSYGGRSLESLRLINRRVYSRASYQHVVDIQKYCPKSIIHKALLEFHSVYLHD